MIRHTDPGFTKAGKRLAEHAARFALQLFNERADNRLVYHNFSKTAAVVEILHRLGQENRFDPDLILIAELAAWMVDTGYLNDYENPVPASLSWARLCFEKIGLSPEIQAEALQTLEAALGSSPPETLSAQLLHDALLAWHYGEDFTEKSALLRLELELAGGRRYSPAEWARLEWEGLLQSHYFTPKGKLLYSPILTKNLTEFKSWLDKNPHIHQELDSRPPELFKNLERKTPVSGNQTFFRTNYRNHINLSAIADNKANIMISVNAILISVIITILTYKNLTESTPMILMPSVIFLVSGLSSLIFAVLSARPKVTSLNQGVQDLLEARKNIVFFGNFVSLSPEQYEEALDAVLRDSRLLYGNMARDLYHLGKVLDKKYRYLTISYNLFMVGFIATVLSFLVLLFA